MKMIGNSVEKLNSTFGQFNSNADECLNIFPFQLKSFRLNELAGVLPLENRSRQLTLRVLLSIFGQQTPCQPSQATG